MIYGMIYEMAKQTLTDRLCATAKVPDGRRQLDIFDVAVPGLCLRISAGGARSFFLVYTKPGTSKRAWLKLGQYAPPAFTLATARKRAKDQRVKIADGADPVAEKRAASAAQTVADLVENYIRRRAAGRRSADEIARRLRKNVSGRDPEGKPIEGASKGCIGNIKLADLHRRDLTRCVDAVVDRGAGVEANRVFEDVRAMVRWARGRGDLDENLTEGMKRPTEVKERDRVLSADEIKTVWAALDSADMRESTRRILRLCLITGQRVGEIAGMLRTEISDIQRIWTIPAERSKNGREHVVPLADSALAIIRQQLTDVRELSERKGRPAPPFVFPGPGARAATTAASIPKALKRLEVIGKKGSTILGVEPWTPHDLRRTAATHMEELGISPFIIGHVLNHVSSTKASITSRVYARYDYAKEKLTALTLWAERLQTLTKR